VRPPTKPPIGSYVVDTHTERVGMVMGHEGPYVQLRPLGGGKEWEHASGWIALAIFCISMYGGLAFLLKDLQGRTVLPLFRIGSSRQAIEAGLGTQLESLENEAGVRRPL